MLILRDIDTLRSARGIGEWGLLNRPCCRNKHFYSRTDSRNLTTIPYTMAIVRGETVREEQANGLICSVNKRMSVKVLQWHVSVALGMEKGLESTMWSCLVRLWSFLKRRCMVDRKMSAENKIIGATTEVSLPPTRILHPYWRNAVNKGSHCRSHLYEFTLLYTEVSSEDILLYFVFLTLQQPLVFLVPQNIFQVACDCFILTSGSLFHDLSILFTSC